MGDYRTAYGVVPFRIHSLMEIPAGVFGKRSGYTLLSEQRLHKQLNEDGRSVGANEWYFDLNHILSVLYSLYIEMVGTIESARKWGVYFHNSTVLDIVKVIDEKDIRSKLYDGIMYGSQNTRSASAPKAKK